MALRNTRNKIQEWRKSLSWELEHYNWTIWGMCQGCWATGNPHTVSHPSSSPAPQEDQWMTNKYCDVTMNAPLIFAHSSLPHLTARIPWIWTESLLRQEQDVVSLILMKGSQGFSSILLMEITGTNNKTGQDLNLPIKFNKELLYCRYSLKGASVFIIYLHPSHSWTHLPSQNSFIYPLTLISAGKAITC